MQPFSTYSRLLFPVIASAGAVGLSIGLIIPLPSIVLEQRGIAIIAIGLNATIYSLAILLAGPFLPAIIHRIGLLKSMFVMAYTAGMVVGPLFCSASMQVAGPSGLLVLPAIAPAFFILLVLRREDAAAPRGNRI